MPAQNLNLLLVFSADILLTDPGWLTLVLRRLCTELRPFLTLFFFIFSRFCFWPKLSSQLAKYEEWQTELWPDLPFFFWLAILFIITAIRWYSCDCWAGILLFSLQMETLQTWRRERRLNITLLHMTWLGWLCPLVTTDFWTLAAGSRLTWGSQRITLFKLKTSLLSYYRASYICDFGVGTPSDFRFVSDLLHGIRLALCLGFCFLVVFRRCSSSLYRTKTLLTEGSEHFYLINWRSSFFFAFNSL